MKKLILKWLGVDEVIKENNQLKEHNKRLEKRLTTAIHRTGVQQQRIHQIVDQFQIGVDVHMNQHREQNWAVVCIKGKPDYVKFVSLKSSDAWQVKKMLGAFNQNNRYIDAPIGLMNHIKGL